ncbi:MAG TPA: LacI family transcriptional regulator [Bacteroidetes bacterium]|nr:LacI family transcriptional regulator [Bacteroidota bacterium]
MQKRVNIKTIADLAGVSITTVSRVLNGLGPKYRISEPTCKRIFEIAEEMNYKPNIIAQSLRLKKTNAIGLILPDIGNPFFATLARIITIESKKRGYSIILADTEDNIDLEQELMELLLDRNIDAIIIAPCSQTRSHIEEVIKSGKKIILVDRYYIGGNIPYVTTDNYYGAYEATKYLLQNGHRDIACIQGSTDTAPNIQRVKGFTDACKKFGVKHFKIAGDSFTIQNGYLETKLLLSSSMSAPTAILCLSSTILLGVLKALKEADLSVPDNVSLLSFDNQPFMDYLNPPISSIAQPVNEIGTFATKVLIDSLEEGRKKLNLSVKLRPQIILRNSVRLI